MSSATETALGTHSEVGKLRTVMVHRPDLAHERLSPTNCHELLFDDVIWVRRARQEHDAFVDLMREHGVEVLLLHELLAETLADADAREWLLARRLRPEDVTVMFAEPLRAWLDEQPAEEVATRLTGGITVQEMPAELRSAIGKALQPTDFVLAAAPQPALHPRHERLAVRRRVAQPDVLARPPARDTERRGDLPLPSAVPRCRLQDLVRRRRPRLGQARDRGRRHDARRGRRRPGRAWASAAPRRAVSILARNMFEAGAARLVIGAQMPRERAAMHLDTVFTFCDRNVATLYEPVVSQILPILFRPDGDGGVDAEVSERSFLDELRDALGIEDLKLVTTGGDEFEAERNQWDDGNNVVALEPGRGRRATSATRRRTQSWRRPASRCSPSPARSSDAAAAAATA